MKALILKDFYIMQKQLKTILAVMAVYAVLFVPQGMLDMMPFMAVLFGVMYIMTSMSFDETLKWDRYALCGPLTRTDLVRAKYVAALLLVGVAFVFGLLVYVVGPLFVDAPRPFMQSAAALAAGSLVGLLGLAILIPLMYKLGVEKSRLLMIGTVLVPVGLVMLFSRYAPPSLKLFIARYIAYFPFILLALVVVGLLVSYRISLRIYNNKDF